MFQIVCSYLVMWLRYLIHVGRSGNMFNWAKFQPNVCEYEILFGQCANLLQILRNHGILTQLMQIARSHIDRYQRGGIPAYQVANMRGFLRQTYNKRSAFLRHARRNIASYSLSNAPRQDGPTTNNQHKVLRRLLKSELQIFTRSPSSVQNPRHEAKIALINMFNNAFPCAVLKTRRANNSSGLRVLVD